MKIAAIEAMWQTEPAPASFTIFGLPDQKGRVTHMEVKVPWMLGLVATRSADTPVPGISELVGIAQKDIVDGLIGYRGLMMLKVDSRRRRRSQDGGRPCRAFGLCIAS